LPSVSDLSTTAVLLSLEGWSLAYQAWRGGFIRIDIRKTEVPCSAFVGGLREIYALGAEEEVMKPPSQHVEWEERRVSSGYTVCSWACIRTCGRHRGALIYKYHRIGRRLTA
jgi:hypothetical protein